MRILFFAITQFGIKGLRTLIDAQEKPIGVVTANIHSQDIETIRLVCRDQDIPVYTFIDINSEEFLNIVRNELKPDLILTYTFNQKLSNELISLATHAINMHPAYLPNYRGNNPYFWPIANGETSTGVSFHYLTENMDQGDIIYQEETPIHPHETCGMVLARMEDCASTLLRKILDDLKNSRELPRTPQPKGNFPSAPKPVLKDYFINWNWPRKKIIDRIRALNPFAGAYTQYKQTILSIHQATATQYVSTDKPGTIVSLTPNGPLIKCIDGALVLNIVTVGKKYLLSGNDFIEYEKIRIGDSLKTWE